MGKEKIANLPWINTGAIYPRRAGSHRPPAMLDSRLSRAYVHSLGLKFGFHILRGIPKQAVDNDSPIAGSDLKRQTQRILPRLAHGIPITTA